MDVFVAENLKYVYVIRRGGYKPPDFIDGY